MFRTLPAIYIYHSYNRNDGVLNNYDYAWWHWGDEIKMKDSIEFKKADK